MRTILRWILDRRTLTWIGFALLAGGLVLGVNGMIVAAAWAGIIFLSAIMVWILHQGYQSWQARRASAAMNAMMEDQIQLASDNSVVHQDMALLRSRMLDAVQTIKKSKLGTVSGKRALYALPWFMVIGNPAAGKSTAITKSGLQFPLADKYGPIVSGVGGTRNCDWFFTTDGIFLDTAGRYAVHEEDRDEWFGFLTLLKKHRPLAPINGIVIAVSLPELLHNKPEFSIQLAKNLRQRVQELTERLEVFAPVYVLFTKVDKIPGFSDFFSSANEAERERVWGATKPYSMDDNSAKVLGFFDQEFDALYDGLKHISMTMMDQTNGHENADGVFTFPLEFAAIKPNLRTFLATLFEENPFQFKPVFRGFYFSSALQDHETKSETLSRVAQRFHLSPLNKRVASIVQGDRQNSYFLLDLFRNVICEDKALVAQYASQEKKRKRQWTFFTAACLVGLMLGAWSLSFIRNQQLVTHVEADLDNVVKMQQNHLDLKSRLEALLVLQSRIEQLEQYRETHPWSLGFGLYQGEIVERKLRYEYFHGVREVLLNPVKENIEWYLSEVNANSGGLTIKTSANHEKQEQGLPQTYLSNPSNNAESAYNALKTYLMLAERSRAEPGHLNDQLTRFWRTWLESNRGNMTRDQMIATAEKVLSFYLAQLNDPLCPSIEIKPALVDTTRENLRQVMRGMPAKDRIYAEVKARAATRYPAVTVARIVGEQHKDLLTGSYAISGAFTREAWEGFIRNAFKEAATKEQQSSDWVLKTSDVNDLTLEGSPEQIQKLLTEQYKQEYAHEWQLFIQGVNVAPMQGFESTVSALNRLGDPQTSPILTLITALYDQTSWDNPSLVNAGLAKAQKGVISWFRQTILRQSPATLNMTVDVNTGKTERAMGAVGRQFDGIAKLIVVKDGNTSLLGQYLLHLSKVRTRFNVLKNQGDTGPGAKVFMEQTLDGSGSELSDSLRFVDEQMVIGMAETQKLTLRSIFVRPLIQSFAVMIKPAESEINRIWQAQVYAPFQKGLATKYPFNPAASVEADSAEIAQIFGAEGAISKFFTQSIGGLVIRRGDTLGPKTWADMGVNFSVNVVQQFTEWVAPLSAAGVPTSSHSEPQWAFQLLPAPAPGAREYTIEIDNQSLRYRNTQSEWKDFLWPNTQGVAGARITAVTFAGQTIEVANFPGKFGFKRLMDSAQHTRKGNGLYTLTWDKGEVSVSVDLKIISKPEAMNVNSTPQNRGFKGLQLPSVITAPKLETASLLAKNAEATIGLEGK